MRFARSPTIHQVACAFILLVACVQANPRSQTPSKQEERDDPVPENHSMSYHDKKQLEDEMDVFGAEELNDRELPILPPIILLDFVNSTAERSPNFTQSIEEKSKRTIDSSLGYGFNQNSLFSSKHNYFFPSGDAGTAVDIEESVDPFELHTTTENIKPITEASETEKDATTAKPLFEALPDPLPLQHSRENLPVYPPYPVFGQRMKLQKAELPLEFGNPKQQPHTKLSQNPYIKSLSSDIYNKLIATYSSMRPGSYQSNLPTSSNPQIYARPMTSFNPAGFMTGPHMSNNKHSITPRPDLIREPASYYDPYTSSHPKYTIENGIKYEHKVVWKYPDGRYSENPPSSYTAVYSENGQKVSPAVEGGFRPSMPYNPSPAFPNVNQRKHPQPMNNLNSPKPIQFPDDQEQPDMSKEKDSPDYSTTPSGVPLSDAYISQSPTFYQGQYGMRQSPKPGNFKTTISHQDQYGSHVHKPSVEYTISSYNPSISTVSNKPLFTPAGQLNEGILGKYTVEAQNYLKKIFSSMNFPAYYTSHGAAGSGYANTGYHDLLNQNPSISQYIKNPASILNAQPTFIQAGNSLIPVIILKVDGTTPLKSKSASNINLKSLLQQYLMQYADSVSKYTQNTNYDFGETIGQGSERVSFNLDPVEDLKHLTQSLRKREQQSHSPTSKSNNPDIGKPQQQMSLNRQKYSSNNGRSIDSDKLNPITDVKKPSKIKNVQIVKDR